MLLQNNLIVIIDKKCYTQYKDIFKGMVKVIGKVIYSVSKEVCFITLLGLSPFKPLKICFFKYCSKKYN